MESYVDLSFEYKKAHKTKLKAFIHSIEKTDIIDRVEIIKGLDTSNEYHSEIDDMVNCIESLEVLNVSSEKATLYAVCGSAGYDFTILLTKLLGPFTKKLKGKYHHDEEPDATPWPLVFKYREEMVYINDKPVVEEELEVDVREIILSISNTLLSESEKNTIKDMSNVDELPEGEVSLKALILCHLKLGEEIFNLIRIHHPSISTEDNILQEFTLLIDDYLHCIVDSGKDVYFTNYYKERLLEYPKKIELGFLVREFYGVYFLTATLLICLQDGGESLNDFFENEEQINSMHKILSLDFIEIEYRIKHSL